MKMPEFKKPEFKGSKLSLPKPKARAAKATKAKAPRRSIQAPAFAQDLYRDMRDRRLIIPALALLVAIIAVPVALSASAEPAPAPIPFTPPEDAAAVTPAVLADTESGIRDYRERLDELKRKNPFASNFNVPDEAAAGGALADAADPIADTGTGPSPGSGVPNLTTPSSPSPGTAEALEEASDPAPVDTGGSTGGDSEPVRVILAPEVDLNFGKIGETKQIDEVGIGDVIPRKRTPIVIFMGATPDLKKANFVVSRGVSATSGDGSCAPSARQCEFLTLKDGEARTFDYGPSATKYRLKVREIREIVADRRAVDAD